MFIKLNGVKKDGPTFVKASEIIGLTPLTIDELDKVSGIPEDLKKLYKSSVHTNAVLFYVSETVDEIMVLLAQI